MHRAAGLLSNTFRRIEVVVIGLPLTHGMRLAVDATMISPLHADGTPWAGAARRPGASFTGARRSKLRAYPEFKGSNTLSLVVAATEVGGRLNQEALDLLEAAAEMRGREEPRVLHGQAARMWRARWAAMLAVAAQDALAATLVHEGHATLDAPSGGPPTSVDVWPDGARS